MAVSTNFVHWKKDPMNPILAPRSSTGILVHDGTQYCLYVMCIDDYRADVYSPLPAARDRHYYRGNSKRGGNPSLPPV